MRLQALEGVIKNRSVGTASQALGQIAERLHWLGANADEIRRGYELKWLVGALGLERHRHCTSNWRTLPRDAAPRRATLSLRCSPSHKRQRCDDLGNPGELGTRRPYPLDRFE